MRQRAEGERLPILYFTELIGLAFGLKEAEKCKHLGSWEIGNLVNW